MGASGKCAARERRAEAFEDAGQRGWRRAASTAYRRVLLERVDDRRGEHPELHHEGQGVAQVAVLHGQRRDEHAHGEREQHERARRRAGSSSSVPAGASRGNRRPRPTRMSEAMAEVNKAGGRRPPPG